MKRDSANNTMYTQFCIGVELGDDTLVRDLILRGANTMVSYGVDGVITTPMHSALSKGDLPMTLALLSSRSTRVRLADLDAAPRVKRDLVTSVLVNRISNALEDGARETLLQRSITGGGGGTRNRTAKLSLSDCVIAHLRTTQQSSEDSDEPQSLPRASSTDRPRCPPADLLVNSDEEAEEQEEEQEYDDGEVDVETGGSIASSADDSSVGAE